MPHTCSHPEVQTNGSNKFHEVIKLPNIHQVKKYDYKLVFSKGLPCIKIIGTNANATPPSTSESSPTSPTSPSPTPKTSSSDVQEIVYCIWGNERGVWYARWQLAPIADGSDLQGAITSMRLPMPTSWPRARVIQHISRRQWPTYFELKRSPRSREDVSLHCSWPRRSC